MASKSLGTLTLDLVAKVGGFVQGMDAAERRSAKWRKQVEEDAKKVGKGIAAATAAVVAGTTALVVSQVKAAGEISRMAQLSNAGAQEFQRYAIAADVVGISQEKLSDQLKDFNEKLGEFQQSGGGGMRDFFEQIAPQIGITADAFRDLSGPQALQLYYDSLEKAGLSQQQMSFYLESMASDTTALIPLLRDGGAGFALLADEAERAGAIMSADSIAAAEQLSAAMFIATQSVDGFKNTIGKELLPILADMAVGLSDVATDGAIAEDVAGVLGGTLKGLAATAVGAFAAIQLVGRGVAGLAAAGQALDVKWYEQLFPPLAARKIYQNWGAAKDALSVVGEDLDETAQRYATLLNDIWSAGDGGSGTGDTENRVQRVAELLREMREAAGQAGGAMGGLVGQTEEERKAAEKAAKAIEGQITAIERAAKTWGMSADEVKLYTLEQEGANAAQLEYAAGLLRTVSALDKQKEAQESYLSLVESLRTEEEQRTDTLRKQLSVIEAMADVPIGERSQQQSRAIAGAFEGAPQFSGIGEQAGGYLGEFAKYDEAERELESWYATQLEMLASFREERADLNAEWDAQELALKQQHEDAMASIEQARRISGLNAMGDFFGQLTALRETDSKKGQQIAKTAAIAQATINAYTAATGAYASASAIPVVGWVMGPIAAAAALAAGLANVAAIKGQAHDGIMSVPSSGTWNLEKGERVLPRDTAASLDSVLADIRSGRPGERGGSRGSVTVNQTINTTGRIDNRTSSQIANDAARKQRIAQARFG